MVFVVYQQFITPQYLVKFVIVVGSVAFALVVAEMIFRHLFLSTHHLRRQLPRLPFSVFLSISG